MTTYVFNIATQTANGKVVLGNLANEIRASTITIVSDLIEKNAAATELTVTFRALLSVAESTTLTAVVLAHTGIETRTIASDFAKDAVTKRLIIMQNSADPAYTAQWSFRGDDIVNNIRNAGEKPFFDTLVTTDAHDLDSSLAASNAGDGYYLNALNHAVFKGQMPLSFYGSGKKRRRFRLEYIDVIQIIEGKILGYNGKGMDSLMHAFVFAPNPGFNTALPHSNTNPAGFCVKAFVDEYPILPGNTVYVCAAESASAPIPPGCQIWVEFTWDPAVFSSTDRCQAFAAQMIYMRWNISNGLDV